MPISKAHAGQEKLLHDACIRPETLANLASSTGSVFRAHCVRAPGSRATNSSSVHWAQSTSGKEKTWGDLWRRDEDTGAITRTDGWPRFYILLIVKHNGEPHMADTAGGHCAIKRGLEPLPEEDWSDVHDWWGTEGNTDRFLLDVSHFLHLRSLKITWQPVDGTELSGRYYA